MAWPQVLVAMARDITPAEPPQLQVQLSPRQQPHQMPVRAWAFETKNKKL